MVESDGLQSRGSQRVGHVSSNLAHMQRCPCPNSWNPVGFPGGSVVKNLLANAGDSGLIIGSGRSPEEGNSNPF